MFERVIGASHPLNRNPLWGYQISFSAPPSAAENGIPGLQTKGNLALAKWHW